MTVRRVTVLGHGRRELKLAEDRRERGQLAYAECLLADIDAEARAADLSVAAGAYRRALDMAESLHMRPLVAQCLLGLARLHRQAGSETRRARGSPARSRGSPRWG